MPINSTYSHAWTWGEANMQWQASEAKLHPCMILWQIQTAKYVKQRRYCHEIIDDNERDQSTLLSVSSVMPKSTHFIICWLAKVTSNGWNHGFWTARMEHTCSILSSSCWVTPFLCLLLWISLIWPFYVCRWTRNKSGMHCSFHLFHYFSFWNASLSKS